MSDDNQRQEDATTADLSRPVATSDDTDYSLTVEEVLARYEAAGFPRTPRSIQRYCTKGYLKAKRAETPFGEKFLINPASVERHIAYIQQVQPVATGRDLSRQVAADESAENLGIEPSIGAEATLDNQRPAPTSDDMSPPVAREPEPVSRPVAASDDRYVALLERENDFLREQIKVKDLQIAEQSERTRETNVLVGGLQKLLTPLLGNGSRNRPGVPETYRHVDHDADQSVG